MSEYFYELTPDAILDSVEEALSNGGRRVRATGRTSALNSIENRVYDIEFEGRQNVVAKFYRPGRWSLEQIAEEHEFMMRLHALEVPVVPPLKIVGTDKTIGLTASGIYFAIFEKIKARSFDELNADMLKVLGRFLGRLHKVGAAMAPESHRRELSVETYGWESLDFLQSSGFLNVAIGDRYSALCAELLSQIEPFFDEVDVQRVHGDCHLGNLLWIQESPIFVDFDDMVWAPPVQDVWMIAGGRDDVARRDRDILLRAYDEMNSFDDSTLNLIEPLRILRLMHYSAWIAKRWEDPSFPRMFPHFGGERWWQEELEALGRIQQLLENH